MPFPSEIDNTIREAFFTCPRKAHYGYVRNLHPDGPNVHLHAGGAFASALDKGRKAYYSGTLSRLDAEAEALEELIRFYGDFQAPDAGSGANKDLSGMVRALISYFDEYPFDTDQITPMITATGTPAVEFTFAIPIPECLNPDTGEPILYAGRFDMLGVREGILFVVDEKTTTSLGASWAKNWDLNSQFTGYCFAAQEYGYPVSGAIIRGIGILKTQISHAQVIVYRPDWIIKRWREQLIRDINRMIEAYRTNTWDFALGAACSAYSGCPYTRLCLSNDPERWIPGYYSERIWQPLHIAGE